MEQSNPVVNDEVTPSNSEVVNTQEGVHPVSEETAQTPQAGSKTDSALLLKSLQEEREKRRLAEEKAKLLEEQSITSSTPSEEFSDEGRALKAEIEKLRLQTSRLEDERELEKVYNQFPDLKAVSSEFETYKTDFPRHKLANVAKLFLTEKGLMETPRKGLEKTTGGPKSPYSSTMTADEVRDLRTTNYKLYQEKLLKGEIKIA